MEDARVRYACDGVTKTFAVPWYFLADTDLKVYTRNKTSGVQLLLTLDSDYSVSGAGNEAGGSITLGLAPTSAVELAILRNENIEQPTHFVENDAFPATSAELGLDRLAMFAALAKDRLSRTLSLQDSDPLAAGGIFQGNGCRIADLADPVNDTDAATKAWVLAQISEPVGWTPDKDTAQWNANRLQSYSVANTAPTDGYVLTYSATNGRWEPQVSKDASALLGSINTWTSFNTFNLGLIVNNGNISFSGLAAAMSFNDDRQRIQGKFYGTPYSDRTLFRPNTSPNSCNVGFAPYGVGNEAGVDFFGAEDPDNAPVLHIAASATSHVVDTTKTGTGVTQALTLSANGTSAIKIATNGRVLIAGATDNGAAVSVGGFITKSSGAFRAHRNGVAYSAADSTFVPIDFTTEEFDEEGWFDLTTNRYTPLIPGKYMLMGGNGPDSGSAATTGKRHETILYKNGSAHRLFNNQQMGGGNSSTACGGAIVDANGSTDYFELYVWHNFGAATSFTGLAMDCFFEGAHIG
jgi:hypothetical protein